MPLDDSQSTRGSFFFESISVLDDREEVFDDLDADHDHRQPDPDVLGAEGAIRTEEVHHYRRE